jgi:hypothetical protein
VRPVFVQRFGNCRAGVETPHVDLYGASAAAQEHREMGLIVPCRHP